MKNAVRLHNISLCVDDKMAENHSIVYTRCVSIYTNKLIKMGKRKMRKYAGRYRICTQ